jgi:hypothetical protein
MMLSNTSTTSTNNDTNDNEDDVTATTTTTTTDTNDIKPIEICQKLLSVDEVYLYKIPPLQNAGGHRYVVCLFFSPSFPSLFFDLMCIL